MQTFIAPQKLPLYCTCFINIPRSYLLGEQMYSSSQCVGFWYVILNKMVWVSNSAKVVNWCHEVILYILHVHNMDKIIQQRAFVPLCNY